MCGIIGAIGPNPVNQLIFDALTVIQHRGQDAAGMATVDQTQVHLKKANGLVRDVFHNKHMLRLSGNLGIGHIRYPTSGSQVDTEAQPFYVNSPYGIVLAHNGNLTNADDLASSLFNDDLRHLNTKSDSELILNVFAHELQRVCHLKATCEEIFQAISRVHARCRGGYAVVAIIVGFGLVAFRDPNGIRPLIYGQKQTANGLEYMAASESVALTSNGFEIIDNVAPGEAVFFGLDGKITRKQCAKNFQLSPCLFEFVYFARPDSIIDNISVYKVRMSIGKKLAHKIQDNWPNLDIDVVIPIPETSRSAAIPLANTLGVKYREGFVKNRYIGRTFIMPGQKIRKKSVNQKLSVIDLEFKDKNVLLVDDSIVRGTTSKEIIQMAYKAGAKKVYFASAAPMVKYPNIYGIDMPNAKELIAHNRSVEEISQIIGAEKLIFLDLNDLISAAQEGNSEIKAFESSVFDGKYLTGNEQDYLDKVAKVRADEAKAAS